MSSYVGKSYLRQEQGNGMGEQQFPLENGHNNISRILEGQAQRWRRILVYALTSFAREAKLRYQHERHYLEQTKDGCQRAFHHPSE